MKTEPSIPPSTPPNPQPAFPRFPNETPRAFAAFSAFFQLGQGRSLPALAKTCGEKLNTLKNWSAKFHWNDRIQAFNSGRLQHQLEADEAAQQQQIADWSRRAREYREAQFVAAQQLLAAVRCFLESFGDEELKKMTLGQVSRAFQVASDLALKSFTGSGLPDTSTRNPFDAEFQRNLHLVVEHAKAQAAAANNPNPQPPQVS